ncbi:TPA: hypothetical protein ACPUIB_003792 [Escherichia coli]|uniref:hypothetical protein n=1 Tax=Escherichia coli TaxID=562 RepID=UPI001376FBE7|nr:hypothetical protein [Escherichia coli]NBE40949.1 hypothetical protein [Escherichia coli]
MNANAKYPAWVFELYARYFELLAPGEEALSIDEYAECLGFKGDKEMKFKCVSSNTFLFEAGKEYRIIEYTGGMICIEGECEAEYLFDVEMKAAHSPSGVVVALFK